MKIIIEKEDLNQVDLNKPVKISPENFNKMCRDHRYLQSLSSAEFYDLRNQVVQGEFTKIQLINEILSDPTVRGETIDTIERVLNQYIDKNSTESIKECNATIDEGLEESLKESVNDLVSGKYGEVSYVPRSDGMRGETALYAGYHLFTNIDGKYVPYWAGETPMGSSYNSIENAVKGIDAFIDRQRKNGKMLFMKPVSEFVEELRPYESKSLKESIDDYEVKQITFDIAVKKGTNLSAGQGTGNQKFYRALCDFLSTQGMEMAGDMIDSSDVTDAYKDNGYEFFGEEELEEDFKTYYVSYKENKGKFKGKYLDLPIRANSKEEAEKKFLDDHPDIKFYDYKVVTPEESLKEDTVQKANGKWTNRGDDGTEHGEFDTKAEADAQRKAMFAQGYKHESLEDEGVGLLDIAQMHFETGVNFDRNDFNDDEEYDEYLRYVEMGPAGFYEEFSDVLDFDPDFVSEYSLER